MVCCCVYSHTLHSMLFYCVICLYILTPYTVCYCMDIVCIFSYPTLIPTALYSVYILTPYIVCFCMVSCVYSHNLRCAPLHFIVCIFSHPTQYATAWYRVYILTPYTPAPHSLALGYRCISSQPTLCYTALHRVCILTLYTLTPHSRTHLRHTV